MALIAGTTLIIGLGLIAAARAAGLPHTRSAMLVLMGMTVWAALGAAPLAAGGRSAVGALCRAGVIADAGLIILAVLIFAQGNGVGLDQAVQVYLLWAGLVVAAAAATRLSLNSAAAAVVFSLALAILLAGPFWFGSLLTSLPRSWQAALSEALLTANPLHTMALILAETVGIFWQEMPIFYQISRLGQDIPPVAIPWYQPVAFWWCLAALLSLLAGTRRGLFAVRFGTFPQQAQS